MQYCLKMETSKEWQKPNISEIGDAKDLIKDIDVDGTGDANFPGNLASDGV